MSAQQEHEAGALTGILAYVVAAGHRDLAQRDDFQEPFQKLGAKLLKTVDGQVADELRIALTNLKALGELPDLP
jgi:hypothetical protein